MGWKPWLQPKPNETRKQQLDRLDHSCYRCGTVINDQAKLAAHEDGCTGEQSS
jgi:hypothetical protein